jgi:hypothetical protein
MQGPSSQGHHSGTHLRPVFSRKTSQAKSAACSTRAGSRHTRTIAQQGLGIRCDTAQMSFHIIGPDITNAAFRNRLVPHQGTSASSHLVPRLDPTRANSIQLYSTRSIHELPAASWQPPLLPHRLLNPNRGRTLALSVSKIVSTIRMSAPPSTSPRTCGPTHPASEPPHCSRRGGGRSRVFE